MKPRRDAPSSGKALQQGRVSGGSSTDSDSSESTIDHESGSVWRPNPGQGHLRVPILSENQIKTPRVTRPVRLRRFQRSQRLKRKSRADFPGQGFFLLPSPQSYPVYYLQGFSVNCPSSICLLLLPGAPVFPRSSPRHGREKGLAESNRDVLRAEPAPLTSFLPNIVPSVVGLRRFCESCRHGSPNQTETEEIALTCSPDQYQHECPSVQFRFRTPVPDPSCPSLDLFSSSLFFFLPLLQEIYFLLLSCSPSESRYCFPPVRTHSFPVPQPHPHDGDRYQD